MAIANLQAEFERGEAAGRDPDTTVTGSSDGGIAITTIRSAWLFTKCPECKHTFRRGDRVRIEYVQGKRRVRHAGALLPCSGNSVPEDYSANDCNFFEGLIQAWPPPKNLVRLARGHPLLLGPENGMPQRIFCKVCGHTFRPHDQVVICPCSPSESKCGLAVHQDPVTGLHCLTDWDPAASTGEPVPPEYCPSCPLPRTLSSNSS
jgi:hypothetical protein